MQSNSESGYENLNQNYNFSRHQMIDTTVSSLNEDIIIIKENDNNNVTELAILNENIDNIDNMKIENDNFFDKNTKINNNTNKNQNSNQIDYCNFNEDRVINKRRFGKTFTFLFKNGEPMIVIGPHWPFFLFLISFTTIVLFIFYKTFDNKISVWIKLLGFFLYLIHIISYAYTALKNPGIPKQEMELENSDLKEVLKKIKNYKICKICNVIMNRNKDTNHCDDCGICIEGLDHHCVWTSKCVGSGNIKGFYAFIITSVLLMINVIITVFLAAN